MGDEPLPTKKPEMDRDECIVTGVHAFVLQFSSYFGLAPLSFKPKGNSYIVSLSSFKCVYSYIFVTVLAIAVFYGIIYKIMFDFFSSTYIDSITVQVVFISDIIVVMLMMCFWVYGVPRRMIVMLEYMRTIASVDNNIGVLYLPARERKQWAALLFFLLFFGVLMTYDVLSYLVRAESVGRIIQASSHHFLWYVITALEVQFAFTVMSVQMRFNAINAALSIIAKHLSKPNIQKVKNPEMNIFAIKVAQSGTELLQPEKANVIIRKSETGELHLAVSPSDAVYRIASLHSKLSDVVHTINKIYSIPLIIILLSICLHLIITLYFSLFQMYMGQVNNSIHFVIFTTLWNILHILRLLIMVEPCYYTAVEGKKTESLVSRLMLLTPNNGLLSTRLELFSRQLMLQSLSYSPMDLCTLDRPLIASILGAVATYLVILLQFQGTSG